MRKHGQSIRAKIAEAFAVFAKAKVLVRKERFLDELLRRQQQPKHWN